jgi:hypothetical protein
MGSYGGALTEQIDCLGVGTAGINALNLWVNGWEKPEM